MCVARANLCKLDRAGPGVGIVGDRIGRGTPLTNNKHTLPYSTPPPPPPAPAPSAGAFCALFVLLHLAFCISTRVLFRLSYGCSTRSIPRLALCDRVSMFRASGAASPPPLV